MRSFAHATTPWRLLVVALFSSVLVTLDVAAEELGHDGPVPPSAAIAPATGSASATVAESSEPAAGGAGMRVYLDPTTGAFTAPPPGAAAPPATGALSTSSQGLVMRPGTSAAGGVIVDLDGRFQSTISATTADTGGVRTRCHTDARSGSEQ